MSFRITGLNPDLFLPLFDLTDEELAVRHAKRVIATAQPGFPCRVSLEDAEPGEELILLNFVHMAADSPFRSSHAIYVRRSATRKYAFENTLPPVFRGRIMSIRAFDAEGMMVDAELVEGDASEAVIERMFEEARVACLHAHSAAPGCFIARVDRSDHQ